MTEVPPPVRGALTTIHGYGGVAAGTAEARHR
jgi:hypothetical protein